MESWVRASRRWRTTRIFVLNLNSHSLGSCSRCELPRPRVWLLWGLTTWREEEWMTTQIGWSAGWLLVISKYITKINCEKKTNKPREQNKRKCRCSDLTFSNTFLLHFQCVFLSKCKNMIPVCWCCLLESCEMMMQRSD